MKETDKRARTERTFFPDGQIATEITYVGEHIHGTTRTWYPNGNLKKEVPVRESKTHGVVREWNADGELLGECMFVDGTGIQMSWYDDGRVKNETSVRDGIPCGRMRCWDEEGELLVEKFFLLGKPVSKRRYASECEKDASLPSYDNDCATPILNSPAVPEQPVAAPTISPADFDNCQEGVQWLAGATDGAMRTLGELASTEESADLLNSFIDIGAPRVLVIDAQADDDGSESANHLLVELPRTKGARKKVMRLVNEYNTKQGLRPEFDAPQQYALVTLC